MTTQERIKQTIENHDVVLYMKGSPDFPQCGFSGQVIQILQACRAKFMYVNIFEDLEIRESLKEYSNWPTYPQLYIDGELIGGCDIIMDLYNKGELQTKLSEIGGVVE